jgi:polar amino acid transport system substrate-binding protein
MKQIPAIIFGLIVVSILMAWLVTNRSQPSVNQPAGQNTAYQRVISSNTLRCAYIVIPPRFIKDPNTGQYGGIVYEIVEEMGKSLHLKIDWVEEVNFGNLAEGLKTGRYDAVCFALYLGNVSMARVVDYTIPLFYTGTGVYVRADDHRFDDNLAAINSPDITVATVDAEMSQFIQAQDFSRAKTFSLPQNTDITSLLQAVETHKADVTFFDQSNFPRYAMTNPNKLRDLALRKPLRLHAHSFVVNKGETNLASMLNAALQEMLLSGRIDGILKEYETPQSGILRVAAPYIPPP